MSGIRFAEVRARITMAEVLGLIGFVPCATSGDQVRGPCPIHHSASPSGRSFSANLRSHIYRYFKYRFSGNHLDLYAAVTGRSLIGRETGTGVKQGRELANTASAVLHLKFSESFFPRAINDLDHYYRRIAGVRVSISRKLR
jgi:hypothetical protein